MGRENIRTANGDWVKSQEERLIADWLFFHGVGYQSEQDYEHATRTRTHRPWCMDRVRSATAIGSAGVMRPGRSGHAVQDEPGLAALHSSAASLEAIGTHGVADVGASDTSPRLARARSRSFGDREV